MKRMRRVPAEDVDKTQHHYVNRPGRTPYVFPIHDVRSLDDGTIRIAFGGTLVICRPDQLVLIAETAGDI